MARIRTIKPEFFRHYELYEAEKATGLPLRLAFIGLWTVCDREGRFKWRPEMLKVECLPYDSTDFSRVLDALTTRDFIVKYACHSREYGWIPSFKQHQVINNKETASLLPEPTQENRIDVFSRVDHALTTRANLDQGERKGKEGKGKGREGNYENEFSSAPDSKDLEDEEKGLIIFTEKEEKEKSSAKKEKEIYRGFKHLKLTVEEFDKLREKYTKQEIDDILDSIQNYKLNKNYESLYLTANTWLKKDLERKLETTTHGTKRQQTNAQKFDELDQLAALAGQVVSAIDGQNH